MIEPHVPLYLTLAMLLVAGNAFFVAAEFAIVKVRTTRIEEMATSGLRGSKVLRQVVANLDEYLSAVQLGVTMVSLGLGWVGEQAFAALLEPALAGLGWLAAPAAHSIALTAAFMIITVLHIVVGELVPKSVAIRRPGKIARWAAPGLAIFRKVFYPALWLLNGSANAILQVFGIRQTKEPVISESELRILFRESMRVGVITSSEAEIMDRATRFSDLKARDVMVPLDEVVSWRADRSIEENLAVARAEKHTRYPVYDPSRNDLVGIVNLKTLILLEGDEAGRSRPDGLIKELLRVPENRRIDLVLAQMRQRRMHMAAVIDQGGSAIGVLTMEDIIEEIFGEIEDEFEDFQPSAPQTR